MKFTLTYDGELLAQSRNNSTTREKWEIRKQLSPQLAHLWSTHVPLQRALPYRVVPRDESFWMMDVHHESAKTITTPTAVKDNEIDLCASISVGAVSFRPLVRKSYALTCSLDIFFLRNGRAGDLQHGGDLDNRIKTLLDALSVPNMDQLCESDVPHMHCLVEDDALVTGLKIDSRQLHSRPDASRRCPGRS